MGIDVSSCESTEEEMDEMEIHMPDRKKFKIEDINSKEYFLEVKRIILNDLDTPGLIPIHVLIFDNKYRKEMKGGYISPNPKFDAWMCVIGKSLPQFNVLNFKKENPSIMSKIEELRKTLRVHLSSIQREGKKR